MVHIVDVPRCRPQVLEEPGCSAFKDKNLLYLQPAKRRPITYTSPYKKPTLKIESETTYKLSYLKFDYSTKPIFHYGNHEKILANKTGKFDFDTVYKLSYPAVTGKLRRPAVPRSCLSIHGSHDMTTVHKTSYMNPGLVATATCKPYRGKFQHPVPMEYKTVTKESYRDFGMPIVVTRPRKREFWQTKFKPDYLTTTKLSYQYVEPLSKKICVSYRPIISAKIEKDTVYSTSYQVPGRFIAKENVTSG